MTLDGAKLINMSALTRDSGFNVLVHEADGGSHHLLGD